MADNYTFKRLGHLGETHLVKMKKNTTLCDIRSDGPNFMERDPIPLAPRPDPTLCVDCVEIHNSDTKK